MSVAEKQKKSGGLGETVSVIVQALLLALVIRTFLFQPFSIPSGSMRPTLLEGDYLFVTKWAYGYSRYSLPLSPNLFSGRIFGSDPERQKQLSPTLQAARPNAPAFLVMHVQRADGVEQSEALAAALRKAGTPVEIDGFPGTGLRGHAEINRKLGEADYPATPVLDRWLARLFK